MIKLLKKMIYYGYVVTLMAFTIWYGHFMYPLIFGFEGKEEAGESFKQIVGELSKEQQMLERLKHQERQTVINDLGYRVIEQPYIEGRFHHIGFRIERDHANPCVRCHGNVPHDQSREVRSFLNMHVFYIGCQTCHIRPDEGVHAPEFRWYDKQTGKLAPNPPELVEIEDSYLRASDFDRKYITYGNYGVKIAPGRVEDGKFSFSIGRDMLTFVDNYLLEQNTLKPEQQSQVKRLIHRQVNKQPIVCEQCHTTETPYIPFAELGYPPRRVHELTTTAVVGMINKYEQFWLPSFLSPGGGRDNSN